MKFNLPKDWQFLKSVRFWSIVLIALAGWLKSDALITEAFANFLITVAGGYAFIRTTDRFVDKISS